MRTQDSFSTERNPTGTAKVRFGLSFGAAGAVTLAYGFGLNDSAPPVLSASPGQYTITIDKPVFRLIGFTWTWKRATGAAILQADLLTDNSASTGVLIFETKIAAGTLTNPANGDAAFVSLFIDETGLVK